LRKRGDAAAIGENHRPMRNRDGRSDDTATINRSVSGGSDDGRDDLATVRFTLLVRPRFVTVPHAAEGLAPKRFVGLWRAQTPEPAAPPLKRAESDEQVACLRGL